MSKFNTSTPSGFHELTPAAERVRQQWIRVISESFESFGFMPITTPLVEREENLLGKGGNPKEMYVLKRLHDDPDDASHSGNAFRFDHTVPLALYVARHFNDLNFPFKRYAIGPVLRGERAQKGRYRQFDQCDIDVIGSEKLDVANDALVVAVIVDIFKKLCIGDFVVRINNRKILKGICLELGIKDECIKYALDKIDDLEKKGLLKIKEEVRQERMVQDDIFDQLFSVVGNNIEDMEAWVKTTSKTFTSEMVQEGIRELELVHYSLQDMGVEDQYYNFDLRIARGLDYYTGTVYETKLLSNPEFGSVCSGGRYEDLAEVFTGKRLPGVGISIGLTRLLVAALDAGLVEPDRASPSDILVIPLDETPEVRAACLRIATKLRLSGKSVEVYLESKKLPKKFDYAQKIGIPECVIIGENELESGMITVKNMQTGEQREEKF